MSSPYQLVLPAIRGIQAGREYFASMCPLGLIPRLFSAGDQTINPEFRAQRQVNKGRLPEIARYLTENSNDYILPAITASVDESVQFVPVDNQANDQHLGLIHVPLRARLLINDGQHRRAAIERALELKPELSEETITVVLFIDRGLKRSQQVFADLNRHAIRPSRSLGVLYDHRDDQAEVARLIILKLPCFGGLVDLEKSTLAPRSRHLFTLSALYTATAALLNGSPLTSPEERAAEAIAFWSAISDCFPDWERVRTNKVTSGEIRKEFIHSHGVVLHALGIVGRALMLDGKGGWDSNLFRLQEVNWRRENVALWSGRAIVNGTVSKSQQHVSLTANAIKTVLGLPLSEHEELIETQFDQGAQANAV